MTIRSEIGFLKKCRSFEFFFKATACASQARRKRRGQDKRKRKSSEKRPKKMTLVANEAPIVCLHFYVNIREIDHVLCRRKN